MSTRVGSERAVSRVAHSDDPKRPVFSLRNVLSDEACDELIAFSEAQGYGAAPVTTRRGPVMMPDLRNNTRVMLDAPELAAMLWHALRDELPEALEAGSWRLHGLNERLRFYRYDPGQLFDWHFDGAFERSRDECSQLTLMLYLNGDFEGGQTEFEDGRAYAVTPERGAALVFYHHVRHRGAPVTRGRKYVLRTDVMYVRAR